MVLSLLPAALLFGVPFLLLAAAPCVAGWMRHRRRAIPVPLLVITSVSVVTVTVTAVVVMLAIGDGIVVDLILLAALVPWVAGAVATNVLLWMRPSFDPSLQVP